MQLDFHAITLSKARTHRGYADGDYLLQFSEFAEEMLSGHAISKVVCPEQTGIPLGASAAARLGCGLVIVTKAPLLADGAFTSATYSNYTGNLDAFYLMEGLVSAGERVAFVDDYIETGGTARGVCHLIEAVGASVVAILCGGQSILCDSSKFKGVAVHDFGMKKFAPPDPDTHA